MLDLKKDAKLVAILVQIFRYTRGSWEKCDEVLDSVKGGKSLMNMSKY
jgi:hypothetical protein